MRVIAIVAMAAGLAGCGESPSGPEAFKAQTSPGSGSCRSAFEDYCRLNPANCSTFEQAVARHTAATCTQPRIGNVRIDHCVGVYRAVSWDRGMIGGGYEYFDGEGRMFAASFWSDYGATYCGRSFSQHFGAVPECAGEIVHTSLCVP